jgi:hypothetical protein
MAKKAILTIVFVFCVLCVGVKNVYAEPVTPATEEDCLPLVPVKVVNGWIEDGRIYVYVVYENGLEEPLWTKDINVFSGEISYGATVYVASKETLEITKMVSIKSAR